MKASLLFLRRFSEKERARALAGERPSYKTFFAVAEHVGKDKRGNPVFRRDERGRIVTVRQERSIQNERFSQTGTEKYVEVPVLDDDSPLIAEAFRNEKLQSSRQ